MQARPTHGSRPGPHLSPRRTALKKAIFFMTILSMLVATMVQAKSIKIAVYPSNDPAKLQQVVDTLARYLSEATGDTVTGLVTRDYKELAQRVEDDSVDIAWINTLNYVRLKEQIPSIQYIATYMEQNPDTGKIIPYYQSYIITTKASGLKTLDDLKGKRFAFTDAGSTSGYAYPSMLLRKHGIIPPQYFLKVFFLKKHDRVIKALVQGSIDAGAVSDGTFFTAQKTHGDIFEIIAKSDPIPLDAVVAAAHVPQATVKQYQKALAQMPVDDVFCQKTKELLGWNAAGFDIRDNSFYDSVREALQQ